MSLVQGLVERVPDPEWDLLSLWWSVRSTQSDGLEAAPCSCL